MAQRYQLAESLAKHDNRHTWIALDREQSPPQPVVIKLLSVSSAEHWESLKLFERESQVLQSLNHPQIPEYLDSFELEEGLGFGLVQTYIPGKSLKQRLNESEHFSPEWVKAMARSMLNILSYLHELSPPVLHRDIKPSNIILGEDGQIYLVDFGAVQNQAAVEGQTFTVVGTYGYAPMEQYGGRAVAASDLYSLGTTLIHLLTGVAPMNLPQDDTGIRFQDYTSAERPFVNWLAKLSEPQLRQRFGTAREALATLEQGIPDQMTRGEALLARPYGSRIQVESDGYRLTVVIPAADDSLFSLLGDLIMMPILMLIFVAVLGGLTMLILSIVVLSIMAVESAAAMPSLYVGSGLITIALLRLLGYPQFCARFEPYRSLNLESDGQILKIQHRLGIISYWKSQVALKEIKQVYAHENHIRLVVEGKRIKIAQRVALSIEELRWLGQEFDRQWRIGKSVHSHEKQTAREIG